MRTEVKYILELIRDKTITIDNGTDRILNLFGVSCSKNLEQPKSRGCCSECGEGYDNEEEWLYNTECEICGHPIPQHLIVKRP